MMPATVLFSLSRETPRSLAPHYTAGAFYVGRGEPMARNCLHPMLVPRLETEANSPHVHGSRPRFEYDKGRCASPSPSHHHVGALGGSFIVPVPSWRSSKAYPVLFLDGCRSAHPPPPHCTTWSSHEDMPWSIQSQCCFVFKWMTTTTCTQSFRARPSYNEWD